MKKRKKFLIVSVIVILLAIFLIALQDNGITILNYKYSSKKVNEELKGYKIIQISDLHNKKFGKNQSEIINIIKSESPNLIVITGDIIDSYNTNIDIAIQLVDSLKDLAPIYYITGNHEYRLDNKSYERLMSGIENTSTVILDNEYVEINYNGESFYLIGLNDKSLSNGTLGVIKNEIDDSKLSVLLAHEPQYFEKYASCNIDLVLSGHAHGGQIRLPYIGGLYAPGQGFFPRYTSGDYHIDDSTMVVSRGLGGTFSMFRIFNNPEIVSITLI